MEMCMSCVLVCVCRGENYFFSLSCEVLLLHVPFSLSATPPPQRCGASSFCWEERGGAGFTQAIVVTRRKRIDWFPDTAEKPVRVGLRSISGNQEDTGERNAVFWLALKIVRLLERSKRQRAVLTKRFNETQFGSSEKRPAKRVRRLCRCNEKLPESEFYFCVWTIYWKCISIIFCFLCNKFFFFYLS